jgi:hypothetical protein
MKAEIIENLSKDLKQKFCESIEVVVLNTIYTNNATKSYLSQLKNLKNFIQIKKSDSDIFLKTK